MSKIQFLFSALILSISLFSCSNDSNDIKLQNENIGLKNQLDSLLNSYDNLYENYLDVKSRLPDTVNIIIPTDSINWIDSVRYTIKDSLLLIPHDTTIINFKDSLVVIPRDTLITHLKDSLVYNFRDTLLYNYKDSIIISYDERTFPEENIEKYLNLFFKTDSVEDTAGLKFNFSVFDGPRKSYLLDKNYCVPDSVVGWRLEWYLESQN